MYVVSLLFSCVKSSWYSLNRRLGGLHCLSELFGEEKDFFLLPEIEPTFLTWLARRLDKTQLRSSRILDVLSLAASI